MSRAARALEHVDRLARAAGGGTGAASLRDRARLTVTFHPDRPGTGGVTAAQGLAADGRYRTQFETGTSAGGLDAVLGGARSAWERAMFAGAYDDAGPSERPRYGGLDLAGHPDGACPRYGSAHLRLRRIVLERCTFSWGDSVTEPTVVGTWRTLGPVLHAASAAPEPGGRRTGAERLDRYIEAQVHGGLSMVDVEAVVADPSHEGTPTGAALALACERSGAALLWHDGYRLPATAVDPEFRGPAATALAALIDARLGDGGPLDPALLGRAGSAILTDPVAWCGTDDTAAALQVLKQLWHHLAAFGYGGTSDPDAQPSDSG